jgi:hypothetical protein
MLIITISVMIIQIVRECYSRKKVIEDRPQSIDLSISRVCPQPLAGYGEPVLEILLLQLRWIKVLE